MRQGAQPADINHLTTVKFPSPFSDLPSPSALASFLRFPGKITKSIFSASWYSWINCSVEEGPAVVDSTAPPPAPSPGASLPPMTSTLMMSSRRPGQLARRAVTSAAAPSKLERSALARDPKHPIAHLWLLQKVTEANAQGSKKRHPRPHSPCIQRVHSFLPALTLTRAASSSSSVGGD